MLQGPSCPAPPEFGGSWSPTPASSRRRQLVVPLVRQDGIWQIQLDDAGDPVGGNTGVGTRYRPATAVVTLWPVVGCDRRRECHISLPRRCGYSRKSLATRAFWAFSLRMSTPLRLMVRGKLASVFTLGRCLPTSHLPSLPSPVPARRSAPVVLHRPLSCWP